MIWTEKNLYREEPLLRKNYIWKGIIEKKLVQRETYIEKRPQ